MSDLVIDKQGGHLRALSKLYGEEWLFAVDHFLE